MSHIKHITERALTPIRSFDEGDFISLIQQNIDASKFIEANSNLLIYLQSLTGGNISDLSRVYQVIFQLIPHINRIDFDLLKFHLQKLLEYSSDFHENQRELALQLGFRQIDFAQASPLVQFFPLAERLDSYLNAMHYFAVAIQIANKKDPEKSRETHLVASQLLMRVLQDYQFFKDTLQPLEFEIILRQIESLKAFYEPVFIKQLYEQARDIVIKIPPHSQQRYAHLLPMIMGGITQPLKSIRGEGNQKHVSQFGRSASDSEVRQYPTQRYQAHLTQLRESFRNFLSSDRFSVQAIRDFQTKITQEYRDFFQLLFNDAIILIGPPPCTYDFRVMGSLGREEPCPYSDLELMVLIERDDDATKLYFNTLIRFIELQVVSLGETPHDHFIFTCIYEKNPSGFHFDGGGNPRIEGSLLATPERMAQLHRKRDVLNTDPHTPAHTVLKSTSLVSNDTSLFNRYQQAVQDIFDAKEGDGTLRQLQAAAFLNTRCQEFKKAWPTPDFQTLNLKDQYVAPLYYFLADLALYYGIEATNTLDIIDALVARETFTPRSGKLLNEAVIAIYVMRLSLHFTYGEQKEEGYTTRHGPGVLTTPDHHLLEKIYWLVLRPLYQGEGLSQFNQVDLPKAAFEEVCTNQPRIIPFLVSFLVESEAPLEEHVENFLKLSSRADLEALRHAYLAALPSNYVQHLELIPNNAGLRCAFLRRSQELQSALLAMTTKLPSDPRIVKIESSFSLPRYLNPEVIDRILDNKGDIRKSYDSAHNVSAAGGIHWKQKPTHPLMEYAIHNLIFRVTGGLTPSVELVRLHVILDKIEKTYPVLLSATIPGKTLKETSVPDLQPAQWARWSGMLLCAILTRPGDGRLSNYVLDPDNNIFCIDNDIAFVEPVVKGIFYKVNFCSALFCLFPNRPLDPKVLEEFSGLDVDALLNGWIEDVIKKEQEYLSLFPDPDERRHLYEEDPNNRFKANILFRKGALVTLNFQFTFLQNFLRSALANRREVKACDLLAQLIYMREINVDNTTGKYISKMYTKATQSTIDAKLKWITSRDQNKSLTSLQSDQACFEGKIPTLEEIGRGEYSPAEARGELFGNVLNRSAQYISRGIVDGQRTLQVSFKHLTHKERQSLVLEAITYLATQEKPAALALQYCAALNSTTLTPFLHPGLEVWCNRKHR